MKDIEESCSSVKEEKRTSVISLHDIAARHWRIKLKTRRILTYLQSSSLAGRRLRWRSFYSRDGHNLQFFPTTKRGGLSVERRVQSAECRAQSAERSAARIRLSSAKRPLLRAPRGMRPAHQAPRRRAQPPCFEIANGDRCKYTLRHELFHPGRR